MTTPTLFPAWPATRGIGERAEYVQLLENYVYDGDGAFWWIPAGFVTNMASVPRLVWPLIGPYDLGPAAIIHDHMYREKAIPRRAADRAFYRMMRESGIVWWKAQAAFRAVRAFGRGAWADA